MGHRSRQAACTRDPVCEGSYLYGAVVRSPNVNAAREGSDLRMQHRQTPSYGEAHTESGHTMLFFARRYAYDL